MYYHLQTTVPCHMTLRLTEDRPAKKPAALLLTGSHAFLLPSFVENGEKPH